MSYNIGTEKGIYWNDMVIEPKIKRKDSSTDAKGMFYEEKAYETSSAWFGRSDDNYVSR